MSTLDTIDQETAITALADGDEFGVYQASSGRTKKVTFGNVLSNAPVSVTAGATVLTVTQALHAGRTVVLNNTAPIAITLPAATGTGAKYRFQLQVAATTTSSTIKVANTVDVMQGVSWVFSDNAAQAVIAWPTTASSDTITLNGSTLGGAIGDQVEIEDVKSGFFSIKLFVQATGTEATPFSATV